MSITQLELFDQRLMDVCQCTDELGVTLYRVKSVAKAMKYINPNHENSQQYIVLDLDYAMSAIEWMELNAPAPNIVAVNPRNGHSHYFYALANPVHWNHDSSRRIQRYAYATEKALVDVLGADRSYQGPLAKNPLNKHWEVVYFAPTPYELGDLSAHLELPKKYSKDLDLRRNPDPQGLGRNCALFDWLRKWSYPERRKAQAWFGFEFWRDAVLAQAMAFNRLFPMPLGEREVFGIAKSVAVWTWENLSYEGYLEYCRRAGRKSGQARAKTARDKWKVIEEMLNAMPTLNNSELSRMTGFSRPSIIRWMQRYGR